MSGYEVRAELAEYDANVKFDINIEKVPENAECIAGLVLKGLKSPMSVHNLVKNVHHRCRCVRRWCRVKGRVRLTTIFQERRRKWLKASNLKWASNT